MGTLGFDSYITTLYVLYSKLFMEKNLILLPLNATKSSHAQAM